MILNGDPRCYIKSKYLNRWEKRYLRIQSGFLQIDHPGVSGQGKIFCLKEISLLK